MTPPNLSLPRGWTKHKLGSLVSFEYGASLPAEKRVHGEVVVLGSSGVVGSHNVPMENGPGIIIGRKGTVGAVNWVATPFWPIDTTYFIRRLGDDDFKWLYWQLQTVGLNRMDSSTGVPGLNRNDAYDTEVNRPPVPEQARIVEVLDTIEEAILRAESVIAKLEVVQKCLLFSLVSPTKRPSSWVVRHLGDVADWVSGGTPSKSFPPYWGGSIPWVSPKDMKVFLLEDSKDHLTDLGALNGTKIVPRHSVLVVVRGMILAHTFPVCLTQCEMAINQDVKAIVARPGVSGEFLGYWFRAQSERLLRLVTEATHGTKKIDLEDLKKFPVVLPSETDQKRIASIISTGDATLIGELRQLNVLKAIKSGLSSDLLTGRIRTRPQ